MVIIFSTLTSCYFVVFVKYQKNEKKNKLILDEPTKAALPRPEFDRPHKKRGGRGARQKGDRLERTVVRLLQDVGFGAERIPLSGAAGGSFSGDVTTPLLGRDRVLECKSRANGFLKLYAWLENSDAVILKSDRKDALCVVRLRFALEVASAAEKGKA